MRTTETGAIVKFCRMCGRRMEIDNYFAALPRKYCDECAAEVRRRNAAMSMRQKRAAARERRSLISKENALLHDENAMLRERVRLLEASVKTLKGERNG